MKYTLIVLLAFCLNLPSAGQDFEKLLSNDFRSLKALAQRGDAIAQFNLGYVYDIGEGILENDREAVKWYRKSAVQGYAPAQYNLGLMYLNGEGVLMNARAAAWWFDKSAQQGNARAQFFLGLCYDNGNGVPRNDEVAAELYAFAAVQGHAIAQNNLGVMFASGEGVKIDMVLAYAWLNIAASNGHANAKITKGIITNRMTFGQIAHAQRTAKAFVVKWPAVVQADIRPEQPPAARQIMGYGTGFFVTDDGYLLTNHHVVDGASHISVKLDGKTSIARVIKVDKKNDLAVLKVDGKFSALPLIESHNVKLGDNVFTMGFPRPEVQGKRVKLTSGRINCLAGLMDDAHNFQHSTPIQPGNSGGALVDNNGNVVGVIVSRLRARGDDLPQNVNYAVKSSTVMNFLKTMPVVFKKLKNARQRSGSQTTIEANSKAYQSVKKSTVMIVVR